MKRTAVDAAKALGRDPVAGCGSAIVTGSLVLAIVGPWIVPYDPESAGREVLVSPSPSHPFGTDASGTDVFSVVIAAFRVDVLIAVAAVALSIAGGVTLGALTGYPQGGKGGRFASWMTLRLADMVQALPVFILALALVGVTGPSVQNVVIAVAFVNLPIFLRLTRAAVAVTESEPYVDAARVTGLRTRSILKRHVLPNSLDAVIANASITIGFAILLTAALSFLGAGVRPPTPEWGATIAGGAENLITGEWWISVLPGLVLSTVVLGFAIVGETLRRHWEPSDRSRSRVPVAPQL